MARFYRFANTVFIIMLIVSIGLTVVHLTAEYLSARKDRENLTIALEERGKIISQQQEIILSLVQRNDKLESEVRSLKSDTKED